MFQCMSEIFRIRQCISLVECDGNSKYYYTDKVMVLISLAYV